MVLKCELLRLELLFSEVFKNKHLLAWSSITFFSKDLSQIGHETVPEDSEPDELPIIFLDAIMSSDFEINILLVIYSTIFVSVCALLLDLKFKNPKFRLFIFTKQSSTPLDFGGKIIK